VCLILVSFRLKVGSDVSCYVIGCRDVKTEKFLEITHRKGTRGVPELSLFRSSASDVCETAIKDRYPVASEVTAFVRKVIRMLKFIHSVLHV